MRIVHVTDCYLPRLGGIELHVRDLAVRQRAAGHDVIVVTRTPGTPGTPGTQPTSEHPDVLRVNLARGWLTDLAPDVVHAHASIVSPFALAAAQRSGVLGIPTVVTVHSLWTHAGPLPALARNLFGIAGWPVTWSAVSQPAAQLVREVLGVPVHVVPNAIDLDRWVPMERLPCAGPPRVLSVMRLTSVKRALPLGRILRRVAAHADLRATVVGDGPERATLQRYLRRHGLTDRVLLTGALDRWAIRRHLEEASVFLAPAHRESFGIAALEARASGVPVVASRRSGVATFIEHGRDGLLGLDDRELADHVLALVQDHALRERIAWHNRAVGPEHGWPSALARNETVYRIAEAGVRHPRPAVRGRARAVSVG